MRIIRVLRRATLVLLYFKLSNVSVAGLKVKKENEIMSNGLRLCIGKFFSLFDATAKYG